MSKGTAHTRAWDGGKLAETDFAVEDVSEWLERSHTVVWVDYCGPDEDDLAHLADELGLHELAIEDAVSPHQRPKLDHYDTHLFLSCHAVAIGEDGDLTVSEINAFIGDRWLVTVRKDEEFSMAPVVQRWDRSPDLVADGVSFLLYGLLDVVVDSYFDTISDFDEFYDKISEGIFDDRPVEPSQQRNWFEMRRSLVKFHRLVVPMREAVSALMRREHNAVTDTTYPYYQDIYDHILRATESTDSLRDLVSTIVETNLSLRDYRQNQVMKKVTSWAAIVAVPTLVTGFYGMNVPYPGFSARSGFWISVVVMVALSGGLYGLFRSKDWI
ncbi:MAG: magnesium/cobalt transporter CorA [Acidimicrobiales bacterium]